MIKQRLKIITDNEKQKERERTDAQTRRHIIRQFGIIIVYAGTTFQY